MRAAIIATFGLGLTVGPGFAQQPAQPPVAAQPAQAPIYSLDDLTYLLGPVALYPDPLIALILPAATNPQQVVEADDWLAANGPAARRGDFSEAEAKGWDSSVQALLRFPDVLSMMAEHLDWTGSLGFAFAEQPDDVTNAIQLLRAKAVDVGNLQSSPQQVITTRQEGTTRTVYIAPANPERIYVPVYDSSRVFTTATSGALLFGTGVLVGSAWNNRWGWNNRRWNQGWNQVWVYRPVWHAPPPNWRPPPRRSGRPGRYSGTWRPDRPGVRPERPAARPQRPAARPERPATRPQRPAMRPERPPTRNQRPAARPERPVNRAQRPAARPEREVNRAQRPAARPQRPAARPERINRENAAARRQAGQAQRRGGTRNRPPATERQQRVRPPQQRNAGAPRQGTRQHQRPSQHRQTPRRRYQ